jgi:hypothetical protein
MLCSFVPCVSCANADHKSVMESVFYTMTCLGKRCHLCSSCISAPPAHSYLTPGLSCCQVLDFPQQLPAEALEASHLLSSILQSTNGPSTSGWNDQVFAYAGMHIHIAYCRHAHSNCILLACMVTPTYCWHAHLCCKLLACALTLQTAGMHIHTAFCWHSHACS